MPQPHRNFWILLTALAVLTSLLNFSFAQASPAERAQGAPLAQGEFLRPLIVVGGYAANTADVVPGKEFTIEIRLENQGAAEARNIVATFVQGDFIPRETGGVIAVSDLVAGDKQKILQPVTTSSDLWGKTVASLQMDVNYTDAQGLPYHETFQLTFPIAWHRIISGGPTPTPTPTVTPPAQTRPQLVITSYSTDVDTLKPGGLFALTLDIVNLGNANARQVTMILGGGTSSGGPNGTDTGPGGVSGGSSDLTNFAPLGSSNVTTLGDIPAGSTVHPEQQLIVNVSTNPGAYSLKFTFVYVDEKNVPYTDDQIITLLVYAPPQVEISFYRDPNPWFVGQPNALPLQVVNMGRKSAILGNLKVTSPNAEITNNQILIGNLEPGGYFTLDATAIPFQPGPLELQILLTYTDDFNQAREISQTLTLDVLDMMVPPEGEGGIPGEGIDGGPVDPNFPGEPGFPIDGQTETIWQKIVRFFKGLFGLDSGVQAPEGMPEPGMGEGEGEPGISEPKPGESGPIMPPVKGP